MRIWGGAGRLISWGLIGLLMAPGIALPIAAVVLRGGEAESRVSALPIGLTAFDGFVRECLIRSVLASAVVAFGSLVLGVALGRIAARTRGFGLVGIALAPVVAIPVVGAIGLRDVVFPPAAAWLRPASIGRWLGPSAAGDVPGWLAFAWIGLVGGVPLVALATRAALLGLDRAWEDAARLSGATRSRVWRDLAWPLIRPEVLASASIIFARGVFDPAVPMAFALRRTLAFQVVESATAVEAWMPGTASLCLVGLAILWVVRIAARAISGPSRVGRGSPSGARIAPGSGSTAGRLATIGFLVGWSAFAWAPTVASASMAIAGGTGSLVRAIRESALAIAGDPEARRLALASLAIGAVVGVLGPILSGIGPIRGRRFLWLGSLPPLAIGVGALAIPSILSAASEGLNLRGSVVRVGWPGELARWLDPYGTPGVLLVWAFLAGQLPGLAAVSERARRRSRPILVDAAVVLGRPRGRAAREIGRKLARPPILRAAALAAVLSATSLAPALILAPTSRERPVAVGLLLLSGDPGRAGIAAGLGLIATAANLLAWGLAGPEGRATLLGPRPSDD